MSDDRTTTTGLASPTMRAALDVTRAVLDAADPTTAHQAATESGSCPACVASRGSRSGSRSPPRWPGARRSRLSRCASRSLAAVAAARPTSTLGRTSGILTLMPCGVMRRQPVAEPGCFTRHDAEAPASVQRDAALAEVARKAA